MVIYTHNVAAEILDMFEDVLDRYDIRVPSPEDDERDEDNEAKLYGSVYGELLDKVETRLIQLIEDHKTESDVEYWRFGDDRGVQDIQ